MQEVLAGERDVIVVRTQDGPYALEGICPHAEARLDGVRLTRPLHATLFDVRSGAAPARRPHAVHAVRIVDAYVELALRS